MKLSVAGMPGLLRGTVINNRPLLCVTPIGTLFPGIYEEFSDARERSWNTKSPPESKERRRRAISITTRFITRPLIRKECRCTARGGALNCKTYAVTMVGRGIRFVSIGRVAAARLPLDAGRHKGPIKSIPVIAGTSSLEKLFGKRLALERVDQ